jgi:hypothetical protein
MEVGLEESAESPDEQTVTTENCEVSLVENCVYVHPVATLRDNIGHAEFHLA